MRKNQDNDASKKADEKSMETGSEKKDSAKKKALDKKPALNEPLYDVNVDKNGRADVVSEKAIEEVDYPPELAEYLGEVLQSQREQLGLSEEEDSSEDKSADRIPGEMLANHGYSKLEANEKGQRTETFMDLQEFLEKIGISVGQVVIKEGEDVAQKISEYIEEGNTIEGDSSAREDGYYEDLREYWYDGKIYHEKDVIWLELPKTGNMMGVIKGFSANLDSFASIYSPCDITHAKAIMVSNHRRILSNQEKFEIYYNKLNKDSFEQLTPDEEIWYLANEYAKTMETPGFCVVCLNGKFNVPVESFFNYDALENEDLITIFNVVGCLLNHHRCAGLLVADIGNMQFYTAVRYCNGRVFDWQKRIDQEIEAYRLDNPDFDPYDDPYDNP